MRSVRRTARSAPIATARSRLSSKEVGPMERTTTSAACRSFSVRAISRAFASGGLISLGAPTRSRVCVTGSTWSSCPFGTCLATARPRRGVAGDQDAVPPEPRHHARPELGDQMRAVLRHFAAADPPLDGRMHPEPGLDLLDLDLLPRQIL